MAVFMTRYLAIDRPCFFLAIVYPLWHKTSVPRTRNTSPDYAPERLTALENQWYSSRTNYLQIESYTSS